MRATGLMPLVTPLVYAAVLGIIAVFGWSGLKGDRGLGALEEAEAEAARLEAELAAVRAERAEAENRVARLRADFLDLDLLDERARAVLGYVRPDEIVIHPVTR